MKDNWGQSRTYKEAMSRPSVDERECRSQHDLDDAYGRDVHPGHLVLDDPETSRSCKEPSNRCDRCMITGYPDEAALAVSAAVEDCKRKCNAPACVSAFEAFCKDAEAWCKDAEDDYHKMCPLSILGIYVLPALVCCGWKHRKRLSAHLPVKERAEASLEMPIIGEAVLPTP